MTDDATTWQPTPEVAAACERAWVLVGEDSSLDLDDRAEITLQVVDGRVAGRSACNQYSAAVSIDGEALRLGMAISTMMACEDHLMAAESQFLAALDRLTGIGVEGGRLVLTGPDGLRLVFAPA